MSGTAQVGQTLTAHNGTWSGTAPITYTYQWQREGANIAGATGSTYTPVTADVAHTLDVVVTAHNTAGSASATSAPTAAVAKEPVPPAPTASFTHSPASPEVGQPVEFDATASTCPDGPCTYEWSNDGGPVQPIPPQFPLGSGQTISLTFTSAGTEYIRLLVTDLLGRTATVEHNVTVEPEPPPPPPPTAPSNTAVPTVSGTAQVGQTLTAHNGTWSGTAPITYTYQWQREGANIAGATGSTYTPVDGRRRPHTRRRRHRTQHRRLGNRPPAPRRQPSPKKKAAASRPTASPRPPRAATRTPPTPACPRAPR